MELIEYKFENSLPSQAKNDLAHNFIEQRQPLTCLILDDDPYDAKYLSNILKNIKGYDTSLFIAHDIIEAKNLCAINNFDLLLVDFWMGSGTTVSFIDEIQSEDAHQLTIMLSTFDEAEFYEISRRAGATSFLSKNELSEKTLMERLSAHDWSV